MKTNNQKILLISTGLVVLIIIAVWYITHQSVLSQTATNLASTTAQFASGTTTTPPATTVPTPSKSAPTPTPAPTKSAPKPVTYLGVPQISSFSPAAGSPGTQITIKGSNFSSVSNTVTFGTSSGRHRSDGSPDNVIATVASTDGKTLTFTVPASGPSGILCDSNNHCVAISSMLLQPGSYPVTVKTRAGTSNVQLFTLMN